MFSKMALYTSSLYTLSTSPKIRVFFRNVWFMSLSPTQEFTLLRRFCTFSQLQKMCSMVSFSFWQKLRFTSSMILINFFQEMISSQNIVIYSKLKPM